MYEGPPEDAPPRGVVCIAFKDNAPALYNCNHLILKEWDYYIYSSDIGWHGTSKTSDLLNHLGKRPMTVKAVLQGLWIPTPDFHAIIKRAEQEHPKSALNPLLEDGAG